jgi:hypothetical protein
MWRLEFRLRETIFEKIWVGLGDAQKQQTGWRQLSADTDCDFLVAPDELPSHIHFRSPEKGTSETLRAELPLRRPGASGGGRRHTR